MPVPLSGPLTFRVFAHFPLVEIPSESCLARVVVVSSSATAIWSLPVSIPE